MTAPLTDGQLRRAVNPSARCGPVSRTPTRPGVPGVDLSQQCPEIDNWMQDRHSDLQDAMIEGDGQRVLEIISKMAEGCRVFAANDRQFHGVMRKYRSARHGLTVKSRDGVSTCDMISRKSMLNGLCQVEGTCHVAFRPDVPWSEYLWEDAEGEVHSIAQGEGGEQGDPKMPLLCAVGQHQTLDIVSRSSREDETVCSPTSTTSTFLCESDRVGQVYTVVKLYKPKHQHTWW